MDNLTNAEEKRKRSTLPLGLPWFVKCMRLYAAFNGRARRREFLIFLAWCAAISSSLSILITPTLTFAADLLFFLPSLTVNVRRLHDTGRNGWWILLPLGGGLLIVYAALALERSTTVAIALTVIGLGCIIYFWYLALSDSQPGTNKYGENPKETGRIFP